MKGKLQYSKKKHFYASVNSFCVIFLNRYVIFNDYIYYILQLLLNQYMLAYYEKRNMISLIL